MSSQPASPSPRASPSTPNAVVSPLLPDMGLQREESPVQRTKRAARHRNKRLKQKAKAQRKISSAEQEAHLDRLNFERECKQDRRWLHAQYRLPGHSSISKETYKELLHFFGRPTPDSWTTDETVYGNRVPDVGRDSRLVWERLQDQRFVWVKENWDGFANNYAPEKDWWKKAERKSDHGKPGKGAKRGHEEADTESSGAEDLRKRYGKKLSVGERDEAEMMGYMTPIPVRAGE